MATLFYKRVNIKNEVIYNNNCFVERVIQLGFLTYVSQHHQKHTSLHTHKSHIKIPCHIVKIHYAIAICTHLTKIFPYNEHYMHSCTTRDRVSRILRQKTERFGISQRVPLSDSLYGLCMAVKPYQKNHSFCRKYHIFQLTLLQTN